MKVINGYKMYPLTAAQKLHFFYQQFCPEKQVLNIGTSLTIEQSLDFEALKEAIYKAYVRCESMRLRLTRDEEGNVWQYVKDREERDIEFFDFSGWEGWAAESKMKEWTGLPFALFDSPLNRIVMVITPDGFQGMYTLVNHMTMDAQSLILFLKDVIELYCNMKYEGIEYPREMTSYIEQLEKDLSYEAGSRAQQKDKAFFEELISSSEPVFNSIFGPEQLLRERKEKNKPHLRAVKYVSDNVKANIDIFELEAEPSGRLLEFCAAHRISMVCLLLMGLRTYLQKENGNEDVSVNTTVARRATLLEKKCGGTRIHCFPFRTIVKETDTFMEGLLKIRDGQNQLFRHANYDPAAYYKYRNNCYGLEPGQTYEPFSLTYQPLTLKDKGLERLGDIRYKSAWYSNGTAAHALYLTVMHRAQDNGMNFCFEHQVGTVSYEKLQYVYYYLLRILFKGVENPELTVGEVMEGV